ncbi:Cytochrome p450, partial [Thalictrum thalictroides]
MLGMENDFASGIPFTRDSTKAIILDMFAAGTDTSSIVSEWAMSELVRHPEVMEKVQKEIREIAGSRQIIKENDTEEMRYLKAVIKETLRLHPPAPLLTPRKSIEKVQMHGYDIPAKTTILINAFAIGRDRLWWEDPNKFWPE